MSNIKGIVVDIGGDTTKLEKAIKDVNKTSGELKKELKDIEKGLKFDPTNTELLSQKQKVLAESIKATADKLDILKKAEESATKQLANGEIGTEQMRALQREILACENQLQSMTQASIDTKLSLQEIGQSLNGAGDKLNSIGNKLTQGLTLPIATLTGASVKVGADFEKSMSKVQAISGATGEELAQLESKAAQMGANTSKSASQSADALGYMALAGWKTGEMMSGLEPILRASEAGGMDLAICSDLVTDSMSTLGVATNGLGQYLDIVTQAQNNSNTSMEDLLTAYVDCGGTLKNLNVPLEESATLLGVLANRGIKGAEAGTAFNSILVNLIGANSTAASALDELGVSAWDADGNFIGITETLKLLQGALSQCTDEELTLFQAHIGGKTQLDTLQALLSGVGEEYGVLSEKLNDCNGVMEATSLIMQDNLAGDFTTLKSQLEATGISIGDIVNPQIRELLKALTDLLKGFNDLDEGTKRLIIGTTLFAAAIGPATKGTGLLFNAIGSGATIVGKFVTALKAGKTAMQAFSIACNANPIMLVASAIAIAVSAFAAYKLASQIDESNKFTESIEKQTEAIKSNREAMIEKNNQTDNDVKRTQSQIEVEKRHLEQLEKKIPKLEELGKKTNKTAEEENELKQIIEELNKAMPDLNLKINEETGLLNLNAIAIEDNIGAYKKLAEAKGIANNIETVSEQKVSSELNRNSAYQDVNSLISSAGYNKILKEKYGQYLTAMKRIEDGEIVSLPSLDNLPQVEDFKNLKSDTVNAQIEQINELITTFSEAQSQYSKADQQLTQLYEKQKEYSDSNAKTETTKDTLKATKTSQLSEEQKNTLKNLELQYKNESITQGEYINQRTNLRDEYFQKDSEGWLEHNAEIISMKNKANEAAKKSDNKATKEEEKAAKEAATAKKEAIREELSLLEYKKTEGIISEQEYYDDLKNIRDNNYTYMDSDWRSITQKMANVQKSIYQSSLDEQEQSSKAYIERMKKNDLWGEDSASAAYGRIKNRYEEALKNINNTAWESAAKRAEYEKYLTDKIINYAKLQEQAYTDAYNSRFNNSKDWISERNFYGDWTEYGDNEIEAWKRTKEYTQKEYEEGKLIYSDYAKQIKEIDKNIYSASKDLAQKLVDKIKESENAKLEAVKDRVAEEKALLEESYAEADREEKLKKLYTQEKYYRNSLTKEGQDKYNSIINEIKSLERQKQLAAVEAKGEAEISVAEQRYNEATASADELANMFVKKFIEGNSIAINEQAEILLEAQKQSEEFATSEEEKIKSLAETVAEGVDNIFTSYSDEQEKYMQAQLKKLEDYKKNVENVFKGLVTATGIIMGNDRSSATASESSNTSYNYNHYGDYNFKDKQDLNIYNKEANANMFSVFGK